MLALLKKIVLVPEAGLEPSPKQPGPVAQPAGTPPFVPSFPSPNGQSAQGAYPEELEDFEGSASQTHAGIAGIIVSLVGAALLI